MKSLICYGIVWVFLLPACIGQGSGWAPPNAGQYSHNATLTGLVWLNDTLTIDPDDELAFVADNEIRGLGSGIVIGGQVYYFVTIYSNQAVDTMTVQYYNQVLDEVYTSSTPFIFNANQSYGDFDHPYELHFYEGNVAPIVINPIPTQIGLESCPLSPIFLDGYLGQQDTFEVIWTYLPNSDLIVNFAGDTLGFMSQVGFEGTTLLSVIATSQAPGNPKDTGVIEVIIYPSFAGPEWTTILGQGIVKGDTFQRLDLANYEIGYAGNTLEWTYQPVVTEIDNPISSPLWSPASSYPFNMTITADVRYTPMYRFSHPDDLLAAKIDDQVVGVATQHTLTGLYFLTVGNNQVTDTVELFFYSGLMKDTLKYIGEISFIPGQTLGTIEQPFAVDLTPILPIQFDSDSVRYQIVDTSFVGQQTFKWIAYDSIYPHCLSDTTSTTLCIVDNAGDLVLVYADQDGDGLGDPNVSFTTCSAAGEGYVSNADDCDDNETLDPDITIAIIENSGYQANDGIICSAQSVSIQASGGLAYEWDFGATTSNIFPTVTSDTSFNVTVTFAEGCKGRGVANIFVEGKVVTTSLDSIHGSLRSVVGCAVDGDTITFDQPTIVDATLHAALTIDNNITMKGLSVSTRPAIVIDYNLLGQGLVINMSKSLIIENVDLQVLNYNGQGLIRGGGALVIQGQVEVRE